tara:strand:+ start:9261 stop:10337 length:1077 start_codon:yes stop_codon:yes gene_type:complete
MLSIFGISFLIGISITIIVIPLAKKFGKKFKIYDNPNTRSQHNFPLIRTGGLGIFISFFATEILILSIFKNQFSNSLDDEKYLIVTLIGVFITMFIGIADDVMSLSPILRLISQFILCIWIWSTGIKIEWIDMSLSSNHNYIFHLPIFLSILITMLWIAGIINAMNWIDGLDGLATGLFCIISLSLLIINYQNNYYYGAITASCLFASCLGFLKFNYKPASIIMGDSGSNFLGFTLATNAITANNLNLDIGEENISVTRVIILFLLFAYPILDMIRVITLRLVKKTSPIYPDRIHFHHFLYDIGLNHNLILLFIFSVSGIFISLSFLILDYDFGKLTLLISLIFTTFILNKIIKLKRT